MFTLLINSFIEVAQEAFPEAIFHSHLFQVTGKFCCALLIGFFGLIHSRFKKKKDSLP